MLLRVDHQLRLLFSGFLVTFQILTSGDPLFLIRSICPIRQQSTNYSISSLVIQHSLQGTVIHATIIKGAHLLLDLADQTGQFIDRAGAALREVLNGSLFPVKSGKFSWWRMFFVLTTRLSLHR